MTRYRKQQTPGGRPEPAMLGRLNGAESDISDILNRLDAIEALLN